MVIKFYISSTSGNKEVGHFFPYCADFFALHITCSSNPLICLLVQMKKRQMKSQLIMESKGVRFEVIDISDPSSQHEKTYMQRNAIPKPGARNAIPPQFFNDEPFESDNPYCGDYDGFDEAVETDTVEEFLKLPRGSLPQVPIIIHNLSNPNSREVSTGISSYYQHLKHVSARFLWRKNLSQFL